MNKSGLNTENYREHLANQKSDGSRVWIYPKIIKGVFYKYRTYVSWFLLAFFFLAPFIKIGGYPFLLFNFVKRTFVIFGQPFWPQDFYIFVFYALTAVVFIVVFTLIFGRVWCGWTCPQTIFMEMVFRKIENLVEGNANKQRKLKAMPWNAEKLTKKGIKHFLFFTVSFLIAHTFLAYIIGIDELWARISGPMAENYVTFIGLVVFTIVFYLVFAKLRELVCIMICPYGRLQGVMLDENSMVVAYDYKRGEPRGKIRKKEKQEEKGDCVDCDLCVDVCPTGIDIRNGTQLECINCTACMDACDSVMSKIKKPEGLIRIDSKNNIENGTKFQFTSRIKGYILVMVLLFGASVAILANRTSVAASIFKVRGMTYSEAEDGTVTNLYNLSLVNKSYEDKTYGLESVDENVKITMIDPGNVLEKNSEMKKVFMLVMQPEDIKQNKSQVKLRILIDGEELEIEEISFLAPIRE